MAPRFLAFAPFPGIGRAVAAWAQSRHPISSRSCCTHTTAIREAGQWADRVDRALATGLRPIAIEQDLVWFVDGGGRGRSLVAHDAPATGDGADARRPFLQAVRRGCWMPRSRRRNRGHVAASWILHLDFKSNEACASPSGVGSAWPVRTGGSRGNSAPKTVTDDPQPFAMGTAPRAHGEMETGQSGSLFYDHLPAGARLRLFGTRAGAGSPDNFGRSRGARRDAAIAAAPEALMPLGPTNYRRWANFSWAVGRTRRTGTGQARGRPPTERRLGGGRGSARTTSASGSGSTR